MRLERLSIVLLVVFLAGLPAARICASGSSYLRNWFVDPTRPSSPAERFLAGELGIVEADRLKTVHQVVVFRHLTGLGMTPGAVQAFGELEPARQPWFTARDGYDRWREVLNHYQRRSGPAHFRSDHREVDGVKTFRYFLNCLDPAFATAAETWEARRATYGEDSPWLEDWFEAQVVVFENCGKGPLRLPAALPPEAPELARQDRRYQTAAAHFYATDNGQAESLFRALAEDEGSPWQSLGRYLALRSRVRLGSVGGGGPEALRAAAEELTAVLADPSESAQHERCRRLLDWVLLRLEPDLQRLRLARELLVPDPPESLSQTLVDFAELHGGRRTFASRKLPCETVGEAAAAWLVEWVACLGDPRREATLGHLEGRWHSAEEPFRDAWLLALASRARGEDGVVPDLLAALAAIPSDHPLAPSAVFHRARLLIEAGEGETARTLLDVELARPARTVHRSDENRLRGLRLRTAHRLSELVADGFQRPVTTSYDDGVGGPPAVPVKPENLTQPVLIAPVTDILNAQAGPQFLAQVVEDLPDLPPGQRDALLFRAWTLSLLFGRHAEGEDLAARLEAAVPALKAPLAAYRAAESDTGRELAAALLFLDEWVPAIVVPTGRYALQDWYPWCSGALKGGTLRNPSPKLLPRDDREALLADGLRLGSVPLPRRWVADTIFSWADRQRQDSRVPEALHLLVRRTRFSACRDGDISKGAFDRLHRRYGDSEWAGRTPYWYK
ncbi:MAG: hypothetical protein AAF604_16640 [Acidobacteriota bacterium]